VARQLKVNACFLVADARFLPFKDKTFDQVFSYSVLQDFDKDDARSSFNEIGRVLKGGGCSKVQMPNAFGIRNVYQQLCMLFRAQSRFDVRYWRRAELCEAFSGAVGRPRISVDAFSR